MNKDTKNQKLLKLNKEMIKKLDHNGLRKALGGGGTLEAAPRQKIGE